VIGQFIYYYGGLRVDFKATNEIIAFDITKYEWHQLKYQNQKIPSDMERYGHQSVTLDSSWIIFGGSTPETEDDLSTDSGEKKISLQDLLVLETDETTNFEKNIQQVLEEKEENNIVQPPVNESKENNNMIKPPPIPHKVYRIHTILSNFIVYKSTSIIRRSIKLPSLEPSYFPQRSK